MAKDARVHGRISVIINTDGSQADQVVRAVRALRQQTFASWEGILVGEPAPGASNLVLDTLPATEPRLRWHEGDVRGRDALLAALARARGKRVLLLDPSDELRPGALAQLVEASGSSGDFALGRYQFHSRIGSVPGAPLQGLGPRLGLSDWVRMKLAPLSFQLIDTGALRTALSEVDSIEPSEATWSWALAIALARPGATWRMTSKPIGVRHLASLAPMDRTLKSIVAHLQLLESSWAENDEAGAIAERDAAERPWVDAFISLKAFGDTLEVEGERRALDRRTRFGNLYATWWQRLGFYGPAPLHVLHAQGGTIPTEQCSDDRRAARLIEELDLSRPVVLLGLGRNARLIARGLREKGATIRGYDEGMTEPPAWALEDGIDLEFLCAKAALDDGAQRIMTIRDDEAWLARLPRPTDLIRWNDIPRLLAKDAMRQLGGRVWPEPKPSGTTTRAGRFVA